MSLASVGLLPLVLVLIPVALVVIDTLVERPIGPSRPNDNTVGPWGKEEKNPYNS
jgi:hypothetical protein